MLIQNVSNLASMYAATKPAAPQLPTGGSAVANATDTVQISPEAIALAKANGDNGKSTQVSTGTSRLAWLSEVAHSSSEAEADSLAHDLCYGGDQIGVTEWSTEHPPLRLASNNQILTDADIAYFNKAKGSISQDRIHLYETEKAKGTPAAEIVDKFVAYDAALPERFKALADLL